VKTFSFPSNGTDYTWNGSIKSNMFTVTKLGLYYVTAYRNGCSASDSMMVNYDSAIIFKLPKDTVLCLGQSLLVDLGDIKNPVLWQDHSVNKKYIISKPGSYKVSAINACGKFEASVQIGYDSCNC